MGRVSQCHGANPATLASSIAFRQNACMPTTVRKGPTSEIHLILLLNRLSILCSTECYLLSTCAIRLKYQCNAVQVGYAGLINYKLMLLFKHVITARKTRVIQCHTCEEYQLREANDH
jgi:hypothetical protein